MGAGRLLRSPKGLEILDNHLHDVGWCPRFAMFEKRNRKWMKVRIVLLNTGW